MLVARNYQPNNLVRLLPVPRPMLFTCSPVRWNGNSVLIRVRRGRLFLPLAARTRTRELMPVASWNVPSNPGHKYRKTAVSAFEDREIRQRRQA